MQIYLPHRRKHFGYANAYSVQFGGTNEYIDFQHSPLVSFGDGVTDSPFSFGAWVKAPTGVGSVLSKTALLEWEYETQYTTTHLFFIQYSLGSGSDYRIRRAPITWGSGWRHIMCTSSGGGLAGMKIYIDGVRLDDTSISNGVYVAMSDTAADLLCGFSQGAGYSVNKTAHPFIFSVEATLAQVGEVFAKKMGDLRTTSIGGSLVLGGHFPLGQASYPVMNDYSGNALSGSMINMENTDITTDVPT